MPAPGKVGQSTAVVALAVEADRPVAYGAGMQAQALAFGQGGQLGFIAVVPPAVDAWPVVQRQIGQQVFVQVSPGAVLFIALEEFVATLWQQGVGELRAAFAKALLVFTAVSAA